MFAEFLGQEICIFLGKRAEQENLPDQSNRPSVCLVCIDDGFIEKKNIHSYLSNANTSDVMRTNY